MKTKINRVKTFSKSSNFFCMVVIVMAIVCFYSCSKDEDELNSLVGTNWRADNLMNPETGQTGYWLEILFTSETIGIMRVPNSDNNLIVDVTFSYYKNNNYWQMMLEDGSSFGRFDISKNTLYWHRPNGTALSFTKK